MKFSKFILFCCFFFNDYILSLEFAVCIKLNSLDNLSGLNVHFMEYDTYLDYKTITSDKFEYLDFTKSDFIEIAELKIKEDKVGSQYEAEYFYWLDQLLDFAKGKLNQNDTCEKTLLKILTEEKLSEVCLSYYHNFEKFRPKFENFDDRRKLHWKRVKLQRNIDAFDNLTSLDAWTEHNGCCTIL